MERVRLKTTAKRMDLKEKRGTRGPSFSSSILDESLIRQFCKLIRVGHPPDAVSDFLGITTGCYWDWMRKGEQYINGDGEPQHYAIYAQFVRQFKKAFAEYRMSLVSSLHASRVDPQWYRHLAILERRDRKTWGRNDPQGGTESEYQADEKFL